MNKDSVSEDAKIVIRNRPFSAIFVSGKGPYWFLLETGTHTFSDAVGQIKYYDS